MIAKLIQIGNSKGVRLPKKVIDKYEIGDELEIIESEEGILIRPVSKTRENWDKLFQAAKEENPKEEDFSDFKSLSNNFDESEWTW